MKRIWLLMAIAALILMGATARNASAQLDMLPPDLQDKVNDLMATRWPPMLYKVSVDPAEPAADAAITVTADVYNDSKQTDDETSEVYIYYSVDGGKEWLSVEMEQQDNKKQWVGEIPGQPSGTTIQYGIKAKDSSGNLYVEAICKMEDSPFNVEGYMENDCVAKEDVTLCEAQLPRGCMFPLSNDDSPVDDEASLIPDDFDVWDYRVGYDDTNIYMDLTVQGKVSQGTASPMNIHLYLGAILNPDKPASGSGLTAIANQGGALVHGPLLTLSGGLAKPCSFLYQKGGTAVQDETAVKCKPKGNHLLFTLSREAVGDNPSKYLEFISLNAAGTSISPVSGTLYDNSHFTYLKFQEEDRTITVP